LILPSGLIVPWITLWSGEVVSPQSTFVDLGVDRLRYSDPQDDDTFMDVLWRRELNRQGSGGPIWGQVHARRQRQAMLEHRCQVCGEALPSTNVPWLMPRAEWDNNLPQLSCTNNPPTCERCWPIAAARCPHLRAKGFVKFYVAMVKPWGVLGDIYHPAIQERGMWVSFDRRRALSHLIARQLLVQLTGITRAEDYVPPSTSLEDARSTAYKKQTGRKILTDRQWRRYKKKARRDEKKGATS